MLGDVQGTGNVLVPQLAHNASFHKEVSCQLQAVFKSEALAVHSGVVDSRRAWGCLLPSYVVMLAYTRMARDGY